MSNRRLTKSNQEWIDGVLGGIANYLGINPDLLRIGVLIAFFLLDFKFLFAAYIILMIVMPDSPNHTEAEEKAPVSKSRALKYLGIILVISGIYYLFRHTLGWSMGFFRGFLHNLNYYLREINHFIAPVREVLIAVLLIVGGFWLLNRKHDPKD